MYILTEAATVSVMGTMDHIRQFADRSLIYYMNLGENLKLLASVSSSIKQIK